MSLLLEALKKAERAKEEAQRKSAARAEDAGDGGLQMEPTVPREPKHVVTRDELPDISAPMDILSEDIRAESRQAPEAEKRAPAAPPRPAATAAAARAAQAEARPAERAAAKKVFEAKFKEPNPKLPFYITMGVLGACVLGTIIYFWMQLRPPPPLVNPNPPRDPVSPRPRRYR